MKNRGYTHIVDAARDGQRIDNFLFSRLKGVPKGLIYRLLRTGKIRVNGKRVKQTYRLQEDDEVKIPQIDTSGKTVPSIKEVVRHQLEYSNLYMKMRIFWRLISQQDLLCILVQESPYGVIEVLRAIRPQAVFFGIGASLGS